MAMHEGYLVVFPQSDTNFANFYDDSLHYIGDIDPDSDDAQEYMNNGEEISADDEMWDDILGDLTPEERQAARAYKLEGEVLNERDTEIEDFMEDSDDEESPGYNG